MSPFRPCRISSIYTPTSRHPAALVPVLHHRSTLCRDHLPVASAYGDRLDSSRDLVDLCAEPIQDRPEDSSRPNGTGPIRHAASSSALGRRRGCMPRHHSIDHRAHRRSERRQSLELAAGHHAGTGPCRLLAALETPEEVRQANVRLVSEEQSTAGAKRPNQLQPMRVGSDRYTTATPAYLHPRSFLSSVRHYPVLLT